MSMARIWVIRRYDATLYGAVPHLRIASRRSVLQRFMYLVASLEPQGTAMRTPPPPNPPRPPGGPPPRGPTPPPPRAPAPPRPHTTTWPDPQSRAAAPAPRKASSGQAAGGAQAPGLARPRAAPAAPADAGVGDDRRRVHERRPALPALSRPDGGHRARGGNHRRDRVSRAWQYAHLRNRPDECRDRGTSRGTRVRAQSRGRVRLGDGDRRDWSVGRGTAQPGAGPEGCGVREYAVLARERFRAVPANRASRDAARTVECAALRGGPFALHEGAPRQDRCLHAADEHCGGASRPGDHGDHHAPGRGLASIAAAVILSQQVRATPAPRDTSTRRPPPRVPLPRLQRRSGNGGATASTPDRSGPRRPLPGTPGSGSRRSPEPSAGTSGRARASRRRPGTA